MKNAISLHLNTSAARRPSKIVGGAHELSATAARPAQGSTCIATISDPTSPLAISSQLFHSKPKTLLFN